MRMNPLLYADSYKFSHRPMYPKNTTCVWVNFLGRKSRIPEIDFMVCSQVQAYCQEFLVDRFNEYFFGQPKERVVREYKEIAAAHFMCDYDVAHIADLHDLGYLPIILKALPEGLKVPLQTPMVTMVNTVDRFFWLPNYLEILTSCNLWKPFTSATTASFVREILDDYAAKTSDIPEFVDFQAHDFSFRGMSGVEDALMSAAAHTVYFKGSDTVPVLKYNQHFYDADLGSIAYSVPASEHSVTSAGGDQNEFETLDRIIFELYPKGIVSIVSDTWDYWRIITEYLPSRKERILARDGKVVIRPDSGVPELIINGDANASTEWERKGTQQIMWEIFGGVVNSKGYRQLDPHIGWIYGDSITPYGRQNLQAILEGSMRNGFASTNGVFGIGSYTYQCVTRDTFGTVCKATYCEVDGVGRNIFKAPKTGAWKKSLKGLLRVNPDLTTDQEVSWLEESGGLLRPVFVNGTLTNRETLEQIRERAYGQLATAA